MDAGRLTPRSIMGAEPVKPWGPAPAGDLSDGAAALLREAFAGLDVEEALAAMRPGRYVLVGGVALGGNAAIYRAVDLDLAREIAVKVPIDQERGSKRAWIDLRNEAQMLAELAHVNVVEVYDVGICDDLAHAIVELCDADLRQWSEGKNWREILARIAEAGQGLAAAHAVGIAHGDVKPENILIKAGVAKVADFGVAVRVRAGEVYFRAGTRGYIAPEFGWAGTTLAADVYALGVTAAQLLEHVQDIPRRARWIVEAALEPDPARRPTMVEFVERLQGMLAREDARRRRARLWPLLATAALAVFAAGFGCASHLWSRSAAHAIVWPLAKSVYPLARAEMAARAGDGRTAIAELNSVYEGPDGPPPDPKVIIGAARVAEALEISSPSDAAIAWVFVQKFEDLVNRDLSDGNR